MVIEKKGATTMKLRSTVIGILLILTAGAALGESPDPEKIVHDAFDYWRGKASVATVRMIIHRPDWERSMTLKVWTEGTADSLFTILEPPRDRGNGTLKKDNQMWTFNPKVNRVIKLPPSMMSQSWMGSDFSNNDLAKSDSLINDYTHSLEGTETLDGKTVFLIKSMPRKGAPVVWGMQTLKIREDHIFLEEIFYDEDLKPVKFLETLEIQMMDGRLFPKVWRMQKTGAKEEYTEMTYQALSFKEDLPDRLFTVSALRNPGR
jgi:outer membrane lipoprotein-sorting protein